MLKSVVLFVSLAILGGVAVAPRAEAQVAAYGEFNGALFTNSAANYALGGTAGVVVDTVTPFRHLVIATDLQGRFLNDSVESLNGGSLGARVKVPMFKGRLTPYGDFLIGFARYNNASAKISTTEFTYQADGGVAKQLTSHWDAVLEYSYEQFSVLGGPSNPQTFSIGAMYHFTKR
jgi:opacity protein-like surface antigen